MVMLLPFINQLQITELIYLISRYLSFKILLQSIFELLSQKSIEYNMYKKKLNFTNKNTY